MAEEKMEEGRVEGRAEGETLLGKLVSFLLRDGRSEDALRASEDEKERKKLYREYGLLQKEIENDG